MSTFYLIIPSTPRVAEKKVMIFHRYINNIVEDLYDKMLITTIRCDYS